MTSQTPKNEGTPHWLETLFLEAFPDFKCLRCGNEIFSISDSIDNYVARAHPSWQSSDPVYLSLSGDQGGDLTGKPNMVYLICETCGHVEAHVTAVLSKASKPVKDIKS